MYVIVAQKEDEVNHMHHSKETAFKLSLHNFPSRFMHKDFNFGTIKPYITKIARRRRVNYTVSSHYFLFEMCGHGQSKVEKL